MELSEKMVLCGVLEKAGATAVTVEKEAEEKTDVVFDAAQTKELTAFPGGYKEFAALEELPVTDVKSVFIGGTTGGNLKDLETVSSMLKGRKIAYGLRLVVAPSDADTYIKAATAGYITDILEAGGIVINTAEIRKFRDVLEKRKLWYLMIWKISLVMPALTHQRPI